MIKEQRASILWSIPHFRRQTTKLTSPVFGPNDCGWEVSLYPEGNGPSKGSHLGLFLDVVLSEEESQNPNTWSRPVTFFRLCILKPGRGGTHPTPVSLTASSSSNSSTNIQSNSSGNQSGNGSSTTPPGAPASSPPYAALLVKERSPQNKEGYGNGFSHPKSWGWVSVFPLSRLSEALGQDNTLYIFAEVVWQTTSDLTQMLGSASTSLSRSFTHLLRNKWLSDIYFEVPIAMSAFSVAHGSYTLSSASHRHDMSCTATNDEEEQDDSESYDTALHEDSFSSLKSTNLAHMSPDSEEDDTITVHSEKSTSSTPAIPSGASTASLPMTLIPAHKAILSSVEYFATMFSCGMEECQQMDEKKPTRIRITDFDERDVSFMLEYIYTGAIKAMPSGIAAKTRLIQIADRYQLPGLHDLISTHILERHLTPVTCLDILEISHVYSSASKHLKLATLAYMKDVLPTLKQTGEFSEWIRSTPHRDLLVDLFHVIG